MGEQDFGKGIFYGLMEEHEIWGIRTNKESQELYRNLNLIGKIKRWKLKWIWHILRMDQVKGQEDSKGNPEGRKKIRRQE